MPALLYNRSCYSLLQSSLRIKQIVSFAKDNGYQAVGLCDTDVLYGAMEFFHCCQNNGIAPLIGLQAAVEIGQEKYPFLIFAANDAGYRQLMAVSTYLGSQESFLTEEKTHFLQQNGCKIIAPVVGGYIEHLIHQKQNEQLTAFLQEYGRLGSFYVGLGPSSSRFNKDSNPYISQLCRQNGLLTVAIPLALYQTPADFESYRILQAISQQLTADDPQLVFQNDRPMLPYEQLTTLFDEESILNTDVFAADCHIEMKLPKASLPKFVCPQNALSSQYLYELCHVGLKKRFDDRPVPINYQHRLNYELSVINSMGYDDYFLIVYDFIRFARKQGIYVGVGRGSAAGSLVAYVLGITHIDPLQFGLLFERFLNPERISMPDIDTDFPDNRRQEVIDYVKEKYGSQHISQIITFATLAARQVIKDTGKALKINPSTIDILVRNIPSQPRITLKFAYDSSPRFKEAVQSSAANRHLYQIALQLEGLPHHISIHAAGIVMSSQDLIENVPLVKIDQNTFATQYTMEYLEELGLIKMDFLGLRNLTTIAEICDQVKASPASSSFNILKIPLDDAKTYQLICSTATTGIFQLESDGMKNLIRQIQPHCFEDIVVTIALFRPGPMAYIPEFLQARRHPETVVYPHPSLKKVLEPTYGIMIYQEQIMQVVQIMAGFSLGKADILRKAISKKKDDQIKAMQDDFMAGARNNGYPEDVCENVFAMISRFAGYGFNKSHSVAYAMLAYQLAYLKANYPLAFYKALLNSCLGNSTKTSEYLIETRRCSISILPPDVNKSYAEYHIEDSDIRYPLTGIKGITRLNVDQIVASREADGPYKDYLDFVCRSSFAKTAPKGIQTLISAGALDSLNSSRATMLTALPDALRYAELITVSKDGQTALDFGLVSRPLIVSQPDDTRTEAQIEYDLIGFYLKGHPSRRYRDQFPQAVDTFTALQKRGLVTVVVMISRLHQHRTSQGDLMCFVTGQDEAGNIDMAFMPDKYSRYANDLKKDTIVAVQGTIDNRLSLKVMNLTVVSERKGD